MEKRIFFLSTLLLLASCQSSKKTIERGRGEETTAKAASNKLLVFLKTPPETQDAKSWILNSGLVWEKVLVEKTNVKVVLIQVPDGKTDLWKQRLERSNMFKAVEPYGAKAIQKEIEIAGKTLLKISKTPCHGVCPVYDLTVLKEGRFLYKGIQSVPVIGEKETLLTEETFRELLDKIAKVSWETCKAEYGTAIVDAPSTFVVYNGKQIEIKDWTAVPKPLQELCAFTELLLRSEKYTK